MGIINIKIFGMVKVKLWEITLYPIFYIPIEAINNF